MKRLLSTLALSLAVSTTAFAVPWCHRGHIEPVADITFSPVDLEDWADANLSPPLPVVANLDFYIASHASNQACQVYAGWSGPTLGVPGAGEVHAAVYAPMSYINTVSGYSIDQGLKFKCMKCLPMRVLRPVEPRLPF